MKIRAILTGATGMVGEGVLHQCLNHAEVESVLVINRRPCGIQHNKLTEIIHADFHDLSVIENRLTGYNAVFFCMGVSSMGMSEDAYRRVTYDLTLYIAKLLAKINPGITFCYVSGTGTDSSEAGRLMWARVKGKTENDLMKLPFKAAFMFRPGFIQPIKGLKNTYTIYKVIGPVYPLLKAVFPKHVCTLQDLGLAMIEVVRNPYSRQVLENRDITMLAKTVKIRFEQEMTGDD